MHILLLILSAFILFSSSAAQAQSCTSQNLGSTGFFNCGGLSGTQQSIGGTDFYSLSNGASGTRQSIGSTDFYSGNRSSMNGTVQSIGPMGFGSWQDGTTSTHQSIGGTKFDSFSSGGKTKNCTTQMIGSTAFTNCY